MALTLWCIRRKDELFDPYKIYGNNPNIFSLKINHGGMFMKSPLKYYVNAKVDYVDMIDTYTFSLIELKTMLQEIGYPKEDIMFYHFLIPEMELNLGLRPIRNDQDTLLLLQYVPRFKVIQVYTEQGSATMGLGIRSLEWHDNTQHVAEFNMVEYEDGYGGDSMEDEDRMEDDDNIVEEVTVDMDKFKAGFEDDLDFDQHEDNVDEDLDCDLDDFDSGSEDEEGSLLNLAMKKYRKRKKKLKNIEEVPFYVGQSFTNKEDIKNLVKSHAVDTRRQLYIVRNEKLRFRVVCLGIKPIFVSSEEKVKSINMVGSSKVGGTTSKDASSSLRTKKGRPSPTCHWALHISRLGENDSWVVQTRNVKVYTVSFIAKEIEQLVETNPGIPLKCLQDLIQKKHKVEVGFQKIFRAKVMVVNKLQGDYTAQYLLLREYCDELIRSNPGTTVKIDVERECNPTSATRQFKRLYICYGGLKSGFKKSGRDILGLDGCFMKGPYPGQILTAVGVDANNGIYPVAFAIVESECTSSWTWFLENLGDDLDLFVNSNFTFISDRQKGLIPAINKLFSAAEHRYCLRHIHENMKCKWRGNVYKDLLWKCASATTVPEFNSHMETIKNKDASLHNWLQNIPAKHWARSHFSGRPKCDVMLNNICEVFNKQLLGARDKPIITCLEFIREYMMRRIGVVNRTIEKCDGPLTPAATKTFNQIKDKASQYVVTFNGQGKYQVTGPWQDQCAVNVETRTCSCRKWELTGMPCKHAVAVNWDMVRHGMQVGIPESWVDEVYWLDTWKKVYQNTIEPINGKELWKPSACPTTLIPPKHHTQIGRPKKARRKSAEELSTNINNGGKLTRKGGSVTCAVCKKKGHNKRGCTTQKDSQATQPTQP